MEGLKHYCPTCCGEGFAFCEACSGTGLLNLPEGATIEGHCVDPLDGKLYPYGKTPDGLYWIADQWAWAGWSNREARDNVLAKYRQSAADARGTWVNVGAGLAEFVPEGERPAATVHADRCSRAYDEPPPADHIAFAALDRSRGAA